MLETRQLHLIQVIAATGSYSAAGRALGLTQPAVTYQMRQLELALGVALTVRRGRMMRLTPAGEVLLTHAERVLVAIRAAEEELGSFVGRDVGAVRIATFPSASATIVADAMAVVSALRPDVEITHVQAEPDEARALVRRGDADIAVTYGFDASPFYPDAVENEIGAMLRREPLFRDEMWLLLPVGHPAAALGEITMADLRAETWNLASDRFRSMARGLAAEAGFEPKLAHVADDFVLMQSLVARRLGVAIVPGLALAAHRNPRTVARRMAGWPARQVQLEVWPDLVRVPSIASMLAVLADAALRVKLPRRR
ncbi:LysR family transcriptional regulator [Microbacteriaceae bacterium VKM Ac-2854]|nr:LysR family transcriptional regulator [Microbacteriaceae bacterium VKM Ac-2854]